MEVIYPRCAGLDVHKQTVVACVRIAGDGLPLQEVRTFATTTSGLLALADWLAAAGGTRVALESPGADWKPVEHLRQGTSTVLWGPAAPGTNVPRRKPAKADARWLAPWRRGWPAANPRHASRRPARLAGAHAIVVRVCSLLSGAS